MSEALEKTSDSRDGDRAPEVALIARSRFFDADWYAATFRDVTICGCDPAAHYLWVGADLGRDPGPKFSTRGYLAEHPDVARAGINPLLHYEQSGRSEGRKLGRPMPPAVLLEDALASSIRSERDWAMTRDEAHAVLENVLGARRPASATPMRVLSGFDTLSAARYVAAAEVLYDDASKALKASVVVPTYNRADRVFEAVRSVLEQSHENLELLVVDDGSTDDTAERLAAFSSDPRLRVFWNDHEGVSAARNTGLENATGDYVFYLDSDNVWTRDYLMLALVGLSFSGADCGYAASCLVTDEDEVIGYRGEPFDWEACLQANYVDMNVFAHKRALYAERGGFDTDLRRVVDWDLILRYTREKDVAFLPFIGCKYLEHAGDTGRITVSQPWLYRKVVAEKNRMGLATGAETLDVLSLRIGLKIAAPRDLKAEWGDYHYASSLAVALRRLGHSVRIYFAGEWESAEASKDDLAIVLRGLAGFRPRKGQLTLMWNISHPDQVPYAEYEACHAIMVASRSYAALLSMILERPVYPLLQCTDIDRFHTGLATEPEEEVETPGLFVGNSRNEYRQMVRWSVDNDVDLEVFGTRWEQFLPPYRVKGLNIPNERLSEKYRGAGFVLNDHWQSMKDFGLVSNRVFDVVASGGRLVSDHIPTIETIFGDVVECVESEAAFRNAVSGPSPVSAERRTAAADYVARTHSFDARARTICSVIRNALVASAEELAQTPDFARQSDPRRRVGLLMQRGRAWWTSSAFIRLIGPLTTEHAHEEIGLDIVALDDVDDPRLLECDVCIVQRIAVPETSRAEKLIATLEAREISLYVDTDDAFFLHEDYGEPDTALRMLMAAAKEVWFSTKALSELYADIAVKRARVRPNALDPRFWRNYRSAPATDVFHNPLRIVYMGTATHSEDLAVVMPAFERLARDYPDRFHLTLIGITNTRYDVPWMSAYLPRGKRSYPAFARHLARETFFDVGIAPLADTPFNAAKSDVKFLDYSAMGLLSVLAEGTAYRDAIDAGLAIGCSTNPDDWYDAIAAILERPEDFAAMREKAHAYLWEERSVLTDPLPLADLVK
ncbi:glycosyl transferase family protein [Roseivivax marinus]|uniref:Glycosyl transferase family protein n=1 Tax=Roseivivax marinus TaxID=1379903 RepID=W4HDZ9_9RHOB|nr:glycosyltransferase [Roseivivax marinus]ETW10992.1 glycosyl transferase family protein [Roseivivax marinus]